jgi:muramoyltetrapeptide carboxypeptidase
MPTKKYTIGIIGLSQTLKNDSESENSVTNFIQNLKSQGHELIVGKTVFSKFGYKTASIEDRLSDLHQMFLDPKIEIILNNTGGYSSNELLEFIDYDLIKKNPKIFVGYSDITAINLALYTKTGLQTINGPMVVDFDWYKNCYKDLFDYFEGKKSELQSDQIKYLANKKLEAKGEIIAGNLSTFNLLLGTKYLPDFKNKVLFLEYDKEESKALPSLERMLWQIRQNGIFDKINGLVFGLLEPEVQKEETEFQNIKSILESVTQNYTFPVLYNAQFGHIYPSWVLQNGRKVEIIKNQIFIK